MLNNFHTLVKQLQNFYADEHIERGNPYLFSYYNDAASCYTPVLYLITILKKKKKTVIKNLAFN